MSELPASVIFVRTVWKWENEYFVWIFKKNFAVTSHHFVEPLVLSVLDFGWLYPWVSKPGWIHHYPCSAVPLLHLGMVRLTLEWLPNVSSRITGRGKIRTQDLAAQSPTLCPLSYPSRILCVNFILSLWQSVIFFTYNKQFIQCFLKE